MRPLRAAPNGLLTTQQLHDRRFTTMEIEAMVRWGWLVRLHRGVYFVPVPDLLARAALTAVGGGELCLESALAHLDLRPRVLGPVHVNLAGSSGRRRQRITIHRRRIPEHDLTEVRGLRTTTVTRSILDVAARQPRYALLRALEQAERLRLGLDRQRLAGNRHLSQPLELLDHYGPCTRSDAEAMFLFLCEDHGIARPLVNQRLGRYEPDFRWPQERVVVEVDGFETHDGRPAFHGDRVRGAWIRRNGYELIRFSATQVEHEPADVAATVLAARPRLAGSNPLRVPR